MEYLDFILDIIVVAGSLIIGMLAGLVIGHKHGRDGATNYYSGYQHENTEIICRLRGEIIWLKASIKRAVAELEKTEDSQYAQYFSDHTDANNGTAGIRTERDIAK